jgi:hypothetical protein
MIDPMIPRLIAVCFGLLWLAAAWHKLAAPQAFRAVLTDYRILPTYTLSAMAYLLPLLEAALGAAWLLGVAAPVTAVVTAALLAGYTVAIAINLLRGRVHIGCGCGLSASAEDQPLSWLLVGRNVMLLVVSLAAMLPAGQRALGWTDYIVLVVALLAAVLLQSAAAQLLRNGAAIRTWRNSYD